MGQFALGIRSLIIKLTLFVVLAALLAWALGGTLFPRSQKLQSQTMPYGSSVVFDSIEWFWMASMTQNPDALRWILMKKFDGGVVRPFHADSWSNVAGLFVKDSTLYFATQSSDPPASWTLHLLHADGQEEQFPMPDRLAVEQQLARITVGLSLQDSQAILRQRPLVLDPPPISADKEDTRARP